MKKTIAFILSLPLLLLFSCTASLFPDLHSDLKDLDAAPYSTHISIEKARQTVQDALDAMALQTKAGVGRTITEGYLMDRSRMTKAAAEAPGDTIPPYYVFNFADDQGYALASVDSRMSPILCIIDQGHFSPDSALTNPGQIALLSRIETDYRMALGLPIENARGEIITAEQYGDKSIPLVLTRGEGEEEGYWIYFEPEMYQMSPFVNTRWGQEKIYNRYMYNAEGQKCPAGCVNIALAQVMNYHGLNITLDSLYVDWEDVGTVIDDSDTGTATGREMLQRYLYKAAVTLNAEMTPTGTGIDPVQVPSFLQMLGYSSGGTRTDLNYSSLKYDLCRRFPVLGDGYSHRVLKTVMGVPVVIGYARGHEWVYDGHLVFQQKRVWYDPIHGMGSITYCDESFYPHCNLGRYGNGDGYYSYGSVNPANPHSPIYSIRPEQVNPSPTKSVIDTVGTAGYYHYCMKMISGIRSVN